MTCSPSATGPLGATLTATTSTGKTATFSLAGSGQAASAKLEATPPLVTFGGTTVGGHLSGSATFRNVGASPLTVNAVHLPSAPFGVSGAPGVGSTIAPGGAVTITLSFDPTATGGGVPPEAAADKRADYSRAGAACLDARGYSVR